MTPPRLAAPPQRGDENEEDGPEGGFEVVHRRHLLHRKAKPETRARAGFLACRSYLACRYYTFPPEV